MSGSGSGSKDLKYQGFKNFHLQIHRPGFRIRHILTGGSGSFGYGSTLKKDSNTNIKAENESTTHLIIELRSYRENYF